MAQDQIADQLLIGRRESQQLTPLIGRARSPLADAVATAFPVDHGDPLDAPGKAGRDFVWIDPYAQMARLVNLGEHRPALDTSGLGATTGWMVTGRVERAVRVLLGRNALLLCAT